MYADENNKHLSAFKVHSINIHIIFLSRIGFGHNDEKRTYQIFTLRKAQQKAKGKQNGSAAHLSLSNMILVSCTID
jgi:hypothetical protein